MKIKNFRFPTLLTTGLMLALLWSAPVQADGVVTNCSDDVQFSSLLAGGAGPLRSTAARR